MNRKLFEYIKSAPTSFHATLASAKTLEAAGFTKLTESESWRLLPGGSYYVTRNSSSVIAFRIPTDSPAGFMIGAAHSDSPCFKLKENPDYKDKCFIRLSTEKYGGMLAAPWLDRPLSIAGRIVVRCAGGVEEKLVDLVRPVAVIPSVAIHMNRNANDNASYNPAVDMVPLAAAGCDFSVLDEVAKTAGVERSDILSHDLFLYNPQDGVEFAGTISAPRLDDLECAFTGIEAIAKSSPSGAVSVMCVFDNEEVGSATKQGAASTFLSDTLRRIAFALGMSDEDYRLLLSSSMMVSCDNAHSVHPNHPEYSDSKNCPVMNGGVVIKYNANQKYTTDAVSAALFKVICERAGVPTQSYANRSDIPGGSTLGAIATTKVSVITVDIGLAQLSMHSSYETAGAKDVCHMIKALEKFFSSSIEPDGNGRYGIK